MQHSNYIVKIRKREANFELKQQRSSGDCLSWQHTLFLQHLWTNTSSPQPSLPTQKVLVLLLSSYFTASKMSKNIIENTCYQQKLETNNKFPSNGKMNEPTVLDPYNEILLSKKTNELLTKATIQMHFKCLMLYERSQIQKATYCMIPLILILEKVKLWGRKTDRFLPGAGGKGLIAKGSMGIWGEG